MESTPQIIVDVEAVNVHIHLADPEVSALRAAQIRAIAKRIRITTRRLRAALAPDQTTQTEGVHNA